MVQWDGFSILLMSTYLVQPFGKYLKISRAMAFLQEKHIPWFILIIFINTNMVGPCVNNITYKGGGCPPTSSFSVPFFLRSKQSGKWTWYKVQSIRPIFTLCILTNGIPSA